MRTQFLLSATSPEHFPSPAAPEFAFLGRSNAGKSSLINALVGERAARTSSSPGRTRSINFFAIFEPPTAAEPQMLLADLPGYGYARISRSISSRWPDFVDPYLAHRPNLALAVCLVDSSIPPRPSDRQLLEALRALGRSFLVVGAKADRLSGSQRARARAQLNAALGVEDFLFCSAKTGAGIRELWAQLRARLPQPRLA